MNKEILFAVEAVSNEKQLPKNTIFEALETALKIATKKSNPVDIDVNIIVDRKTGAFKTFRRWEVVENVENSTKEISLEAAKIENPEIQVGEFIEDEIDSIEFGRIAIQTFGQIVKSKIREAEKLKVIEEFKKDEGTIITATVKKVTLDKIFLELQSKTKDLKGDAALLKDDMIPRENYRPGDKVRGVLYCPVNESGFSHLLLTRAKNIMLEELFKLEVPEINEQLIQIKAIARDAGSRAKVAIFSNDKRIDPVGACVGMRGSRVQAISNELGGEKIDVVLWDEKPIQFVLNAMAPAEISSIIINDEKKSMNLIVEEEKLSLAIGRNGQNIRLASQLTGWTLNAMTAAEAEKQQFSEDSKLIDLLTNALEIDEDFAQVLIEEGFTSIEAVALAPVEMFTAIEELNDLELIEELKSRAKNALENLPENNELQSNLGIDADLVKKLNKIGVNNLEDLAEQSIEDLLEIKGLSKEEAGKLIMDARQICWFS